MILWSYLIVELSSEDRLILDKVISLIASNSLHRTDYAAKKKAGLVGLFYILILFHLSAIDSEVDAYLLEHLLPESESMEFCTNQFHFINISPHLSQNGRSRGDCAWGL